MRLLAFIPFQNSKGRCLFKGSEDVSTIDWLVARGLRISQVDRTSGLTSFHACCAAGCMRLPVCESSHRVSGSMPSWSPLAENIWPGSDWVQAQPQTGPGLGPDGLELGPKRPKDFWGQKSSLRWVQSGSGWDPKDMKAPGVRSQT